MSSSKNYGSTESSREKRRPPRPSPNGGAVGSNSRLPPSSSAKVDGKYISTGDNRIQRKSQNNNNFSAYGKLNEGSAKSDDFVGKKKITNIKHRTDSWGGIGTATYNAIFDNFGEKLDFGAIAGPRQSSDIASESNSHPFQAKNTTAASAARSKYHPWLNKSVSVEKNLPDVTKNTHHIPELSGVNLDVYNSPESNDRKSYSKEAVSRYHPDRRSLFTIASMEDSFYRGRESSYQEEGFQLKDNFVDTFAKSEQSKTYSLINTIQNYLFGQKPVEKEIPDVDQMSKEVDEFSKFARGENSLELKQLIEVDDDQSESIVCDCFDYGKINHNESSTHQFGLLQQIHTLYTTFVYNSECPEFSSAQQSTWAVLMGIFIGIFTAYWGKFIEKCVEAVWVTFPSWLLAKGIFTDLDGHLPLPHYMWITPTIFGGVLSAIDAILPVKIPGQDKWISSLHMYGVLESDSIFYAIAMSTLGMASGLTIGPEAPLIVISGMLGSYVAIITEQSILAARVLNLTAASAAIAGFFGFPMAGAIFVLEVPHRLGLQYYEALSPSIIASIVAVLVNRIVTGNEVKGYFKYPFLSQSLPSHVFYIAILYGLLGAVVGIIYCRGSYKFKHDVHDLFHDNHGENHHESNEIKEYKFHGSHTKHEKASCSEKIVDHLHQVEWCRRMVIGSLAGFVVGMIAMFFPHQLFWGEAQLQSIIDRGHTELPFITEAEVKNMTAYGYCMVNPALHDHDPNFQGYNTLCNGILALLKVVTAGISLGTGIIGGQFWAPLFTGAAASHVLTDIFSIIYDYTEISAFGIFCKYPSVALLCMMGATHVVTFRAHTGIMLILTLTISSFGAAQGDFSGGSFGGGDYSAVFPLLVVACFISLMCTRDEKFYEAQRNRGDIIASPEVLCEPMKHGEVNFPSNYVPDTYIGESESPNVHSDYISESEGSSDFDFRTQTSLRPSPAIPFPQRKSSGSEELPLPRSKSRSPSPNMLDVSRKSPLLTSAPESQSGFRHRRIQSDGYHMKDANSGSQENKRGKLVRSNSQGRSRTGSFDLFNIEKSIRSNTGVNTSFRNRAMSRDSVVLSQSPVGSKMTKIPTYGEIQLLPDLMKQARDQSATSKHTGQRPRKNSGTQGKTHSRTGSRQSSYGKAQMQQVTQTLTIEDIEVSFEERLRLNEH